MRSPLLYALLLLPLTACSDDQDSTEPAESGSSSTTSDATTASAETTSSGDPETTSTSTTNAGETTTSTDDGTTTGMPSCLDGDLGSAVGRSVTQGTASSDSFALMECTAEIEGGGFVADPPQKANDAVFLWTFPSTGSFAVSTIGSDATIGLAPPSCDAEATSCGDDCTGPDASLTITGEAGDQVFLVVETYDETGSFVLAITPGLDPVCIDDDDGG